MRRCHLQTVCIRHEPPGLEGEALDKHTLGWAERINASGAGYLTPAVLDGRWMVRISIGAEATEREDVEAIWAAIRAEAEADRRALITYLAGSFGDQRMTGDFLLVGHAVRVGDRLELQAPRREEIEDALPGGRPLLRRGAGRETSSRPSNSR